VLLKTHRQYASIFFVRKQRGYKVQARRHTATQRCTSCSWLKANGAKRGRAKSILSIRFGVACIRSAQTKTGRQNDHKKKEPTSIDKPKPTFNQPEKNKQTMEVIKTDA
jgi:hypothetical protein